MRPELTTAAAGLAVVMVALTVLWLLSLRLRDASIVDPFWGPGFLLVGLTYLLADGRIGPRGVLATLLIAAWAVRLGVHLLRRNRATGEDRRYGAMRERHGKRFRWVSLFTVFWLQGVILWIVSMPLLGSVASGSPLGALDVVGALIALSGLTIEAVADRQLRTFRAEPSNSGRVLDTGLWRYSRHPNYFGNAVLWWGIYLIALAGGAWWSAFAPALMTFLLLRVSGVTLLERGLRASRPGYSSYVARTSAFVPWPPKRNS
jgi:steroid 5-alpha reductase family enzyme